MNPQRFTWGLAYSMPFAEFVALATLAGLLFTKERYSIPRTLQSLFLAALWLVFFASTLFAVYQTDAWPELQKISKILFMTLITIKLIQSPKKLELLIWVITLSLGFYGIKGGLFSLRSGMQSQVLGPEYTFISGNTEIGLALNMLLPFCLLLRKTCRRWYLRHFFVAMFALSIIAILGTYSRGALLGLVVVLVAIFLQRRGKGLALVLILFTVTFALSFAPQQWFSRMNTIATYEQDSSAMGRINAWKFAINLALDKPFLGAGFRAFQPEMYMTYLPSVAQRSTDAHNIFFQVLAEHGFIGVGLYAGLIATTLMTLKQLINNSRQVAANAWIGEYAKAVQVSLFAYITNGFFLSLSYFDLFYTLVAITIILKAISVSTVAPTETFQRGETAIGSSLPESVHAT